ncbi:MAG TPA: AraC family transcriptional regulator, partial [Novosphingobium sp.]|nr:AraC family transcriptional regulator [Novosphingobium sp.]
PRLSRNAHMLSMVIQCAGRTEMRVGNHGWALSPGDWCVNGINENCHLSHCGETEHLVVTIPKSALQLDEARIARLGRRHFAGNQGLSRLMCDMAMGQFREAPYMGTQAANASSACLLGLMRSVLSEEATASARGHARGELVEAIKDFIGHNLTNAMLSIDVIARELGYSKRYLHMAFSQGMPGTTISDHILNERLLACEQDLLYFSGAARPVSEIGQAWGFVDPAHFSRVFRNRYGVPPSVYRARHRKAG